MYKKVIAILLLISILVAGCSNANQSSILPEDIVVYAIEANENIDSYYMESKITMYEDVEITDLDETMMEVEIVTIEELTEEMGRSLLYVPESLGNELRQIGLYKFNDNNLQDEATQEYFKDGVKKFNISLIKQRNGLSEKELLPGEEEIEIRGAKAYVFDDLIRRISFAEDGIQYSLNIEDDRMDIEEAIEIIEDMKFYK